MACECKEFCCKGLQSHRERLTRLEERKKV